MSENKAPPPAQAAATKREKGANPVDRKENENVAKRKRDMTAKEWFEQRKRDIRSFEKAIMYSDYYYDEEFQYRHVTLPKEIAAYLPYRKDPHEYQLLKEEEWRGLGVNQSLGWEHYMVYEPEPNILLFKRKINYAEEQRAKKLAATKKNQENMNGPVQEKASSEGGSATSKNTGGAPEVDRRTTRSTSVPMAAPGKPDGK